jgi:hypothetical protein
MTPRNRPSRSTQVLAAVVLALGVVLATAITAALGKLGADAAASAAGLAVFALSSLLAGGLRRAPHGFTFHLDTALRLSAIPIVTGLLLLGLVDPEQLARLFPMLGAAAAIPLFSTTAHCQTANHHRQAH